ncbi:hypothetical protein Tco_1057443 [Tanacetum coccineum]|uniref:Uncharacterized protein n=1 Tax=Tanacetum coccineum TaxID=301880 RepID=A0ABQ5H5M7_9ASTR
MTSICDMVGQYMQKKEEYRRIAEDQAAKDRYWKIPICYDDDEDYTIAITPVLSTEEPVDSLIMEDEHLDAIPATESDEVIKSKTLKDDSETVIDSNNDYSSSDGNSYEDIDYVDASPPHSELVSLEEVKDFHPEDGEIEDDILREKLSKINLLVAKIEALNANPTPSSDFVLKSPIPVEDGDSFLEKFETTPRLETFKFDIKEKNSGSTTIYADISLPDLECFYFKSKPDPGELTSIVDSGIRENVSSTTNVNLPFKDDQSPLFTYVVWIFLPFLTYPVAPLYLLACENKDTIFDPGISIYHSFMPSVSHRSRTFMKFNDFPDFEASRARGFVLHSLEL